MKPLKLIREKIISAKEFLSLTEEDRKKIARIQKLVPNPNNRNTIGKFIVKYKFPVLDKE